MARLLVLLALVFIVAYLATRGLARLRDRFGELLSDPAARQQKIGSELVACSLCGVHVPQARALKAPGGTAAGPDATESRLFCSETCRRRASLTKATHTKSA